MTTFAGDMELMKGLMGLFKEMEWFDDTSIFINDYRPLDGPRKRAPFIIMDLPNHFISTQETKSPEIIWDIPVSVYIPFYDWKETSDLFSEVRFAIIEKFNGTSGERAAGQTTPTNVQRIEDETPVLPYYDPSLTPEQTLDALPLYLFQVMIFTTIEY